MMSVANLSNVEESDLTLAPDAVARAVWTALEPSDTAIMVLQAQASGLTIMSANAAAQCLTGYTLTELVGQDFTLLAGPKTEAGAMDRLLAAARGTSTYRTKLRCHNRAAQPFWFGLKLVPADEPGTTGRFVVIGRDISARLRQQEQDQLVQSLLTKVFVTVDVACYIVDMSGRILMANPAMERLLGAQRGALIGTNSLDRYAPAFRDEILSQRAQDDVLCQRAQKDQVEGGNQSKHVEVLRMDGCSIPCQVSWTIVNRSDLVHFRIVTLNVTTPAKASARNMAVGQIQLTGLQAVRQTLGVGWDEVKDRVMAVAERGLRDRLGPQDLLSRSGDDGFVIRFSDASEEEAAARSATLGRQVWRSLLNEGESPELAQVFAAATVLPERAHQLSDLELAASVKKQIDRRLSAIQNAARAQLAQAMQNARCDIEAVYSKDRMEPVGSLIKLPATIERAVDSAATVLPVTETAGLNKDAMLLSFARKCAVERSLQNLRQPILVVLSSDILLERRRMEACLRACEACEEAMRARLILVVPLPPRGVDFSFTEGLRQLRPLCRTLGVAIETLDQGNLDVRKLGLDILVVRAAAFTSKPVWEAKVRLQASSLRSQRCRLLVRGTGHTNARQLFAQGVDLVSSAEDHTIF